VTWPDLEALPPEQEDYSVLLITGCNRLATIPNLNVSGIMLIQDCCILATGRLPTHLHVAGISAVDAYPRRIDAGMIPSCGGSRPSGGTCPHLIVNPLDPDGQGRCRWLVPQNAHDGKPCWRDEKLPGG